MAFDTLLDYYKLLLGESCYERIHWFPFALVG